MYIPILALVGLIALLWYRRSSELFCVSVRRGKVLVVRGRVPGRLLSDIRDVVASPPVARATIRAVKQEHGAQIIASGGVDECRAQRLRNIFRLYPMANLRAAPPISRPTLGQLIGIAWLAWLFERRG